MTKNKDKSDTNNNDDENNIFLRFFYFGLIFAIVVYLFMVLFSGQRKNQIGGIGNRDTGGEYNIFSISTPTAESMHFNPLLALDL
jgi:hypothetical protein